MDIKNLSSGRDSLGRDPQKHIFCKYKGHETDCPDTCPECAIFFKTCGDEMLLNGSIDSAIKEYKRALFLEPKFAEAWVNLGNAYGMKSEYRHAYDAFDRATSIDPVYGKAMFGKAISLRNLGFEDMAIHIADEILKLYDSPEVREFKEALGSHDDVVVDTAAYSLEDAIDDLTDLAYEFLLRNNLLGPNNRVVTEAAICCKEDFSANVVRFCNKLYSSLGTEKVQSESVLTSFYGSLSATLFYYSDPQDFNDIDPFDYLSNRVNLEEIEDVVEKQLNIRNNQPACDALWNFIYSYVQEATKIFEKLHSGADISGAVQDATENAYMMGMMYAMKWKASQTATKNDETNEDKSLPDTPSSREPVSLDARQAIADQRDADDECPETVGSSQGPVHAPPRALFCKKCGVKLIEGSRFCHKCGTQMATN